MWPIFLSYLALFLATLALSYVTLTGLRLTREHPKLTLSAMRVMAYIAPALVLAWAFIHLLSHFGEMRELWHLEWPIGLMAGLAIFGLGLSVLMNARDFLSRGYHLSQALLRAQEETQDLLNRLPDVVMSLDAEGRIVSINPAVRMLLGYEPIEMIGSAFVDFIADHAWPTVSPIWRKLKEGQAGSVMVVPATLTSRAGTPIEAELTLSARWDAAGQLAGVDAIVRDVRAQHAYEQAMREQAIRMENMLNLAMAMGGSLDLHELLDRLLEIVEKTIGYDSASIFIEEGGKYRVLAQRGYPDGWTLLNLPYEEVAGPHLRIMRETRRPLLVPDSQADPNWQWWESTQYVRSWLGAPLFVHDELIGVINLDSRQPHRYTEADAQLMADVAAHVASAIQNARLFARVREQSARLANLTEQLMKLQKASLALAQASAVPEVLAILRTTAKELVGETYPLLFGVVDGSPMQVEALLVGREDQRLARALRAMGIELAGVRFRADALPPAIFEKLQNRQPVILHHLSELLGQFYPASALSTLQRRLKTRTFALFPLHSRERIIGAMITGTRAPEFSPEALELLSALGNMAAVAMDNIRLVDELRQTSQTLDNVISSSAEGMLAVNREGIITIWNPAAERILGRRAEDLVGRRIQGVFRPQYLAIVQDAWAKVMAGEHLEPVEFEYERLDGRRIWLNVIVGPLRNAEGEVVGALFTGRDVTMERIARRQLEQSAKLNALGQIVAGVAHELNNPLTSIIGFAQLLRSVPSLDDTARADVDRVIEQAKRAARIVQNLLVFAREQEPRKSLIDINVVISGVLEMRAYQLKAGNIQVETDLEPALPTIWADAHQLEQVFFNLILNAEQAMQEAHGGGRLCIRSRVVHGSAVRVEVHDDGPGIAPENLSRIFDPFFTTKEVGKGTGLGLSICHAIVEGHGGKIWAESEPGRGSTFIVELPLPASASPSPPPSA